jgi:hypothetical protein
VQAMAVFRAVEHLFPLVMKKYILQPILVLLFLAVVGMTGYAIPLVFQMLDNSSLKFVVLFLVLIVSSNVLSRIATKYVNL